MIFKVFSNLSNSNILLAQRQTSKICIKLWQWLDGKSYTFFNWYLNLQWVTKTLQRVMEVSDIQKQKSSHWCFGRESPDSRGGNAPAQPTHSLPHWHHIGYFQSKIQKIEFIGAQEMVQMLHLEPEVKIHLWNETTFITINKNNTSLMICDT